VTGGGQLVNGGPKVSFGFNVQTGPGVKGQLEYNNHSSKMAYHSTSITDLAITDIACTTNGAPGKQATFEGSVRRKSDNAPCRFTVRVEDCGEPGRNDYFEIHILDACMENRFGRLEKGNIQVH
jgi:hypothetical protein